MAVPVSSHCRRMGGSTECTSAGIYVPFGENWFRYLMRRMAEAEGA